MYAFKNTILQYILGMLLFYKKETSLLKINIFSTYLNFALWF